ncbi:MAG TPA: nucleoside triphosphate pyrophosphohydrolase [Candidatus Saccharimonadales bacterium]
MPTFLFQKLVRDNIKAMHEAHGHEVHSKILNKQDLQKALFVKLHEEADEVASAVTRQELLNELADMYQILDEIRENAEIGMEEVRTVQDAEVIRRGGFRTGLYIEKVFMPDEDNKWVIYCRERPEKYPEVK